MTQEYREMWADLYRFFERCAVTDWRTAQRYERNAEGAALIKKWHNDLFVIDVVAQTVAYCANKGGAYAES